MNIHIKRPKKILKLNENEKKYLSPYVWKRNKIFELLYCNRGNLKNFTGKIYSALSNNLNYWVKKKKPILIPNRISKYKSFISPNLAFFKDKRILFVEAQSYNFKSDIICFIRKKSKWLEHKKFSLKNSKSKFQSPFFFKDQNKNYLFYSKNGSKIERIQLDNDLNILDKKICFQASYINEKYSIYSPTVFKFNSIYHMFYAAWKDQFNGNINYAYSKDGIKWIKKYKNIFKFKKNIKIISEPFVFILKNKIILFYEFKNSNSEWNISFKRLSNKTICNIR